MQKQCQHCKEIVGWFKPMNVISVAVWIHPGPGGDPPPFARGFAMALLWFRVTFLSSQGF